MNDQEVKDKRAQYHREYYVKNKLRLLEINRQYRLKNKAQISQRTKEYRQKNKDKVREYYEKNKARFKVAHEKTRLEKYDRDRHRQNRMSSAIKHLDRTYKRNKRYRDANKEKVKAYNIVHRAVSRGYLVKPIICSNCDNPHDLMVVHHILDYTRPLETIHLCNRCNQIKRKSQK